MSSRINVIPGEYHLICFFIMNIIIILQIDLPLHCIFYKECPVYHYIVTCQAHPVLVKKGESNVRFVLFKFLSRWLPNLLVGLVHLWMDQRIPGPVSCRCRGGSLETPPCWHATIYCCRPGMVILF